MFVILEHQGRPFFSNLDKVFRNYYLQVPISIKNVVNENKFQIDPWPSWFSVQQRSVPVLAFEFFGKKILLLSLRLPL